MAVDESFNGTILAKECSRIDLSQQIAFLFSALYNVFFVIPLPSSTVCRCPSAISRLSSVLRRLPSAISRLSSVVYPSAVGRPPFAVCRLSSVVYPSAVGRPPFAVCRLSSVVYPLPLVPSAVCRLSFFYLVFCILYLVFGIGVWCSVFGVSGIRIWCFGVADAKPDKQGEEPWRAARKGFLCKKRSK